MGRASPLLPFLALGRRKSQLTPLPTSPSPFHPLQTHPPYHPSPNPPPIHAPPHLPPRPTLSTKTNAIPRVLFSSVSGVGNPSTGTPLSFAIRRENGGRRARKARSGDSVGGREDSVVRLEGRIATTMRAMEDVLLCERRGLDVLRVDALSKARVEAKRSRLRGSDLI